MRPSVFVLVFFGGIGASAGLVAAACSSGGTQPQDGSSTDPTEGPASTGPTETTSGGTRTGDDGNATGDPQSDITNDPPDGGVVMNNATTSGDAGASDRMKPVMELVTKNRDKYRACFDLWGKKNPTAPETQITFSIKLTAAGELESAGFKADESDLADKSVETCMIDVTKAIKFPASPSEKVTTYNHRFKFKPKK